jgi:RNA-directed DNA polymerase
MRRFLKAWALRDNDRRLESRVVNYADDFVILCRKRADGALAEAEGILSRLGLVLNSTKTRICCADDEPFDFLGYSFGVRCLFGSGRKYLAAYPSAASVRQ